MAEFSLKTSLFTLILGCDKVSHENFTVLVHECGNSVLKSRERVILSWDSGYRIFVGNCNVGKLARDGTEFANFQHTSYYRRSDCSVKLSIIQCLYVDAQLSDCYACLMFFATVVDL